MVFSSISFLFYFLPVVLLCYFLASRKAKNFVLLVASLFFYFYGEPKYILVFLASIGLNYFFGRKIEDSKQHKKLYLIIDLILNFGMLFYFKYFNFSITILNDIFGTDFSLWNIVMPIGISFFTFQATSYTIDIYRGKVSSAPNIWTFATYLSLFPQLIAGPIVRYETVADELEHRKETSREIANGIRRFIIGLAKKVLLANVLGTLASTLGGLEEISLASSWVHALALTLQLYFDFSGYSDMAIGMGLMFGFHFLENFNYPLIANSLTDFWRRWHISLSSWLKDYIYIPLGGSRVPFWKYCRNILLTWLATGLWHGANWNFVLWGLFFAVFLIIEKVWLLKVFKKHSILAHCYTIFFILISFVIFSFDDLSSMGSMLQNMFSISNPIITREALYYARDYFVVILIALFAATPIAKNWMAKVRKSSIWKRLSFLEVVFYFGLFFLCVAFLVDESFNPFLYFRF